MKACPTPDAPSRTRSSPARVATALDVARLMSDTDLKVEVAGSAPAEQAE